MKSRLINCFFIFVTAVTASTAHGEESLEDALSGFDNTLTTELLNALPPTGAAPKDEKIIEGLTGSIALSSSYNFRSHSAYNPDSTQETDWQGLSKLRTRLNLQYDHALTDNWSSRVSGYAFYDSIYALRDDNDNHRYSDGVLDDYQDEIDSQEVWLRGKLREDLDVKVGRQVIIWGRADSLRVLDVLNPLDAREPGLADIEDSRLPVTMIKTDWYPAESFFDGQWQASFIVVPEMRFSKYAPQGNDYAVSTGASHPVFKEKHPDNIRDSSFAASLSGTFSGWDFSVYAADYWKDSPYLKPNFNALNFADPLQGSTMENSRVTMLGTAGNVTQGAWLFKGELGWFDGIDYTISTAQNIVVAPGPVFGIVDMPTSTAKKNKVAGLVGIEYFGFSNSSISLELSHEHIVDFDTRMEQTFAERNSSEMALRFTHSMMNDQLDLNAILFGNFGKAGGGTRFDASYDIQDALVLTGGIIFYDKGDKPPFDTYYNNDRVFAELKYSF